MPVKTRPEPTAAHRHLQADEVLARLIERHGYLVLKPAPNPFRRLVKAITRQQISMESAAATWDRLTERFDVTPARMQAADPEVLQAVGLSGAKTEYIRTVATVFEDRNWSADYFETLSDETVQDELTEIRGVGPWTAKMFLQFGLGRSDVFPVEDLGIRQALMKQYNAETRAEMREQAAAWAPYRSIGALYLWRAGDE